MQEQCNAVQQLLASEESDVGTTAQPDLAEANTGIAGSAQADELTDTQWRLVLMSSSVAQLRERHDAAWRAALELWPEPPGNEFSSIQSHL